MGPGLLAAWIAVLLTGALPAAALAEGELQVGWRDGLLSVDAKGVALAAVLDEVAAHTRLAVEREGSLTETCDLVIDRAPLRQALEVVLEGRNFALRLDAESATSDGRPLGTLWIYDSTAQKQAPAEEPSRDGGCESLDALGSLELEACRRRLELALAHEDPKVRLDAVGTLIEAGGESSAATLADVAALDKAPAVRLEAIYGLSEIGGPEALETVERALADPDPEVRRAAIHAAADMGGEGAAWALSRALEDDDPELREEAVWALDDLGGEVAAVLLQQALADGNETVRESAAEALGESL